MLRALFLLVPGVWLVSQDSIAFFVGQEYYWTRNRARSVAGPGAEAPMRGLLG